jgi:hypothetical protein
MRNRSPCRLDPFRVLLIALPCILFLPELTGCSIFAGWDITRLNLPLKWYDVQSIRHGALPLWNHYLYAGMPQLAESESGLFYPGNWLMHLPGDFFYWASITYILHFVLAGLFMDMWLRGRGIRPLASFFGAVLFQTAPFLLFHISAMALMQSVVWFPLVLWVADRSLEGTGTSDRSLEGTGTADRPLEGDGTDVGTADRSLEGTGTWDGTSGGTGRRWGMYEGFMALLGGMLVFIGSPQMAFYQGFLLFWYLVGCVFSAREGRTSRLARSAGVLVALVLGAALIGAVIWVPAREFAQGTVRETAGKAFYFLGSNWLTPSRLASAFYFPAYSRQTEVVGWASSLIYIGVLPTLLALVRLMGIRVNWRTDAPVVIMGAVALFFAFGMFNPVNHLLIKLAPFSLFRYQGRLALGALVALIALASHGLSHRLSGVDQPGQRCLAEPPAGSRRPDQRAVPSAYGSISTDEKKIAEWRSLRPILAAVAIIGLSLLAFRLYTANSRAIQIGGIVFAVDAVLTLVAIWTLLRSATGTLALSLSPAPGLKYTAAMRLLREKSLKHVGQTFQSAIPPDKQPPGRPESRPHMQPHFFSISAMLVVYLLFHLIIVYPVGRLATMYRQDFDEAMEFFDLIKRDDGQPARLLVVDVGRFADRDLLEFDRWRPQTYLPNLCAGNTGVFRGVQVMDPYTPLRPVEWNRLIREEIGGGFRASAESGILDRATADKLRLVGIDAVVTSGDVIEIPGYDRSEVDLTHSFGPAARLFTIDEPTGRVCTWSGDERSKPAVSSIDFGYHEASAIYSIDSNSQLVFEVSYDPDWRAYTHNAPIPFEPFHGVFCSVQVEAGRSELRFRYKPASVGVGSRITGVGLALILGWLMAGCSHCKRASCRLP